MQKKRVLVFVPSFPVLTETFIERELAGLVQEPDLDVTVLSLHESHGFVSGEVKKVTHYVRLTLPELFAALVHYFPQKLFKAYSLVQNNKNRPFLENLYLFVKAVGYSRIFQKYHPDLILAHFMSESSTICLVISSLLGVELGIQAHAKDVLQEKGEMSENSELIAQKVVNAQFVTVCNRYAYDRILERCKEKEIDKVKLRYHGIDAKELRERCSAAKKVETPKGPVLFSIGRFVEKKGFEYLVKASRILRDKGIKHTIYLAGAEGPLYGQIKEMIADFELTNQIIILGQGRGIIFDEILSYYAVADIFVLPSINTTVQDSDGIPNVLIEAALLKIPLVTTDAGSILELVENKKTGLVVEQRNEKALAAVLERLLKDKDLQTSLAEAAYKKSLEMFDLKKSVLGLKKLILQN